MDLKRLDLLFVSGRSPLAGAIQLFTDSPYSHLAIVLDDMHIAEMDWRFPLQRHHNNYPPWQCDVYRYRGELTAAQVATMTEFIQAHIGTVDKMFAAAGIRLRSGDIGKVSPADLARSSLLQRVA